MTVIIILVVLGILLFVIEFLLVPGVTIAGIGGLVLTVLGVYKAFNDFGASTGVWVLISTLMLSVCHVAQGQNLELPDAKNKCKGDSGYRYY